MAFGATLMIGGLIPRSRKVDHKTNDDDGIRLVAASLPKRVRAAIINREDTRRGATGGFYFCEQHVIISPL